MTYLKPSLRYDTESLARELVSSDAVDFGAVRYSPFGELSRKCFVMHYDRDPTPRVFCCYCDEVFAYVGKTSSFGIVKGSDAKRLKKQSISLAHTSLTLPSLFPRRRSGGSFLTLLSG